MISVGDIVRPGRHGALVWARLPTDSPQSVGGYAPNNDAVLLVTDTFFAGGEVRFVEVFGKISGVISVNQVDCL